jgi:hypothetical protein
MAFAMLSPGQDGACGATVGTVRLTRTTGAGGGGVTAGMDGRLAGRCRASIAFVDQLALINDELPFVLRK